MENQTTGTELQPDKKNYDLQHEEATAFFDVPASENSSLKAAFGNNFYADKDGLIEIICGAKLQNDPVVNAKLEELKKILISLTSIVAAYVKKYAHSRGGHYKTDIELWELATSRLPLMGLSGVDVKSYSKQLKGVEIPKGLANLFLDVTDSNAASMNAFSSYLSGQGNDLRAGINENANSYDTIIVANSIEVIRAGNEVTYMPKIKFYKANFDRNNSKWCSMCASIDYALIDIQYKYADNVFDYKALDNPDVKKSFDDFINKIQKENIEDSSTFFNGNF